jgi:NitT/TauT family transport system substrate-binding protein
MERTTDARRRSRRQRRARQLVVIAVGALVATNFGGAVDATAPPTEPVTTDAADEPSEPTELVEVRGLIPAPRVDYFFPQLLGEELGYYADEGISITWEPVDGSAFVVQQVASGNVDVGVATIDPVLLGYAASPTFTSVYDTYHNVDGHLFDTWVVDPEIQTLADLEGGTLGLETQTGGEFAAILAQMAAEGLTEGADYNFLVVGENTAAIAEALASGEIDSITYSLFRVPGLIDLLADEGLELRCVSCNESAVLTSQVVIVNNDFAAEHPDLVIGLGRAMAKGTVFGIANPEAGVLVMAEVSPEMAGIEDMAASIDAFNWAIRVNTPGPVATLEETIGLQNELGVEAAMTLLLGLEEGGLAEPVDLSVLLNNDLIDDFNDFDREAITEQAESYPTG